MLKWQLKYFLLIVSAPQVYEFVAHLLEFVMIQFRFLCFYVFLSQILLVPQMAAVIILEFVNNFAYLYLVDYSPVHVLPAFS